MMPSHANIIVAMLLAAGVVSAFIPSPLTTVSRVRGLLNMTFMCKNGPDPLLVDQVTGTAFTTLVRAMLCCTDFLNVTSFAVAVEGSKLKSGCKAQQEWRFVHDIRLSRARRKEGLPSTSLGRDITKSTRLRSVLADICGYASTRATSESGGDRSRPCRLVLREVLV